MSRYIDADKLIKSIPFYHGEYPIMMKAVRVAIDATPTADVEEVRHGKWVWKFNLDDDDFYECSVCGRQEVINGLCRDKNPVEHFPFCHCGAKMDGERSENGKS